MEEAEREKQAKITQQQKQDRQERSLRRANQVNQADPANEIGDLVTDLQEELSWVMIVSSLVLAVGWKGAETGIKKSLVIFGLFLSLADFGVVDETELLEKAATRHAEQRQQQQQAQTQAPLLPPRGGIVLSVKVGAETFDGGRGSVKDQHCIIRE
ncbi:hypothetical protein HDU76_003623 [Blyttiomyces sp. JEL0837]|nr:hypothetical protein HDU76_003623 [Blyttiomyces sp. JEL0837]